MTQASLATGFADIAVVGSALGAYPGAEVVGLVQALPSEDGSTEGQALQVGQLVLVPRLLPCGECDACRRGRVAVCAQRLPRPGRPQPTERLPVRFLLPLAPPYCGLPPPEVDWFRYAAFADALLAPYAALVRAGVGPGSLCAVVGRGARAALAAVVAKAMGAATVIVSAGLSAGDQDQLLAAPFDVLSVLRDERLDAAAIRSALRGLAQGAGLPPHGICVLETSGSDAGRALAIGLLERGGTALLLDRAQPLLREEAAPFDREASLAMDLPLGPTHSSLALLDRAVAEGCQIVGGGSVHPDLLIELLALCQRAGVDLCQLTRRITPSQIDSTMADRRQGLGDLLMLPVVDYGRPSPSVTGGGSAAAQPS